MRWRFGTRAQATRASLDVQYGERDVRITVQDNGRGFAVPATPTEFAPSGHFGLLGMRERAELVGARLDVRSQPGRGTEVSVSLVYPPEAARSPS